jgi:hypothetical protein
MEIEWKIPGENEPGYLRRRRELTLVANAPEMDSSLDYLVALIVVPEDRKEAREALLNLTKLEFSRAIMALLGYKVGAVSGPKVESSATP